MIQLLFSEVRFTALATTPVLVLKELAGERVLPIWTSSAGGAGIVSALEPESESHPSTHDLLIESLASQDAVIESVRITGCVDGLYTAEISVNGSAVTCRPSDGVALALRCGAQLFVTEQVMISYGVAPDFVPEAGVEGEADEVRQFREFLANVKADDFDNPDA